MSLIRQLNSLAEPFGAEKFSYLLPAASFQGPHANANKTLSGQIAAKKSWIYIQSGSNVKCWHLLSCSINYLQECQWQILQVINFFVCCAKSEFVLNLQPADSMLCIQLSSGMPAPDTVESLQESSILLKNLTQTLEYWNTGIPES